MADGDEQELRVVDNRAAMRYEIWSGNDLAGFSTYRVRPGRLDFIHTETEAGFEGHGVAGRLVHDALEDLRTRRFRVVALCPYVAHYIETHPEYADLLVDGEVGHRS